MTDAGFVAAIAAIASSFAAIGAGIVAWRATEIERTKVRIQLHERRFAVFKAVQEALTSAKQSTANIQTDIAKVKQAYQDAWFLFPKVVHQELEEIHSHLVELESAIGSQDHKEANRLKKELNSTLDGLSENFEPHMRLPF